MYHCKQRYTWCFIKISPKSPKKIQEEGEEEEEEEEDEDEEEEEEEEEECNKLRISKQIAQNIE